MSNGTDHAVRQRAYEIWEREGQPDGRGKEHWRLAEEELAGPERGANEGEGNKTSALVFDRNQAAFAKEADVEGLAIAAREALAGEEGGELRKAEQEGRARSRGEDSQFSKKPAQKD
jgi:hypothetical protein